MRELTQKEIDQVSAGPTPQGLGNTIPRNHYVAAGSLPVHGSHQLGIPFSFPRLVEGSPA